MWMDDDWARSKKIFYFVYRIKIYYIILYGK